MPSKEFIESLEDLIAWHLARSAAFEIVPESALGSEDYDRIKDIVRRAVSGAFELVRKQLAEPREGTMTFDQAMEAVMAGKLVTRPGWSLKRAIFDGYDKKAVVEIELDNLDGFPSGSGSGEFRPTDEDRAASDWMEYQKPIELDLYLGD